MRRRVLTTLSALSLLLCVAAVALWVRSHWAFDHLGYTTDRGSVALANPKGGLLLYTDAIDAATIRRRKGFAHFRESALDMAEAFGSPHRRWGPVRVWSGPPHRIVVVQWWLPAALLAVAPGAWLADRVRLRRRHLLGLCPACGYDLRASKERCPECGTPLTLSASPNREP